MSTVTAIGMIAELELALLGPNTSARQRHVLKQALLSLVRLAKSECKLQLIENLDKAAQRNSSEKFRRQADGTGLQFTVRRLH